MKLGLSVAVSVCFFWVIVLCVFPWNKSCIRKSTCCPITRANFGRIKNRKWKWKRINHKILWANCFLCVSESLIEWCEYKIGTDAVGKWKRNSTEEFKHFFGFTVYSCLAVQLHTSEILLEVISDADTHQFHNESRTEDDEMVSVSNSLHSHTHDSHLNFIRWTL